MVNDKIEFARELENRTLKFAINIIHFSVSLGNTVEQKVIRNQLTKSGTAIGANYREANRSRSKADFRNKIMICLSEASEVQYWLEIIRRQKWSRNQATELLKESGELVALFTTISKNLK